VEEATNREVNKWKIGQPLISLLVSRENTFHGTAIDDILLAGLSFSIGRYLCSLSVSVHRLRVTSVNDDIEPERAGSRASL
jgi:hypothetical protein